MKFLQHCFCQQKQHWTKGSKWRK